MRLAVRAEDDFGLQGILLRYQVEGFGQRSSGTGIGASPKANERAAVRRELALGFVGS